MTDSKQLTIVTRESNLGPGLGDSALLIELAPDSPWLLAQSSRPENLIALIRRPEDLRVAYSLARQLIGAQPEWEGVKLLEVFEEIITEELLACLRAVRLHQWLVSAEVTACELPGISDVAGRLRAVQQLTGCSYQLHASARQLELSRKLVRNFQAHGMGFAGFSTLLSKSGRRAFPQLFRYLPATLTGHRSPASGKAWFYTTSYNDTSIGLSYEPGSGREFQYLFEDAATGGRRLQAAGRPGTNLYSFLQSQDLVSARELERVKHSIIHATGTLAVPPEHQLAYNLFRRSEKFRYILDRLIPIATMQIRASRRFLDTATPELVVVGNAAWERVLLLQAQSRKVPSVLLQHGLVHHTLAVADQPVDSFLVRGEFFRQQLCPALKQKATVLNCSSDTLELPRRDHNGSIIYLTAPYHQLSEYHPIDLEDILRTLLRSAAEMKRPLIVRVHPLDSVFQYQESVKRLTKELSLQPDVSYSQGPGLEEALRKSSVAVLHFSTVFLDCIRLQMPIVSFDWHSFPFKEQYKEQGIFQFAAGLEDLERLVALGTAGRLQVRADIGQFLRPTSPGEIAEFFFEKSASRSAC